MFYLDLFAALNRKVDYVLIGGLAIALHGIERATMDIDVTVAMTSDNLTSLVETARELGMLSVDPEVWITHLKPGNEAAIMNELRAAAPGWGVEALMQGQVIEI